MNIFNIPSNYNFLKSIADFVAEKATDSFSLSKITILLPSRRSCNELKRIFLEQAPNEAIILPKIQAIGDIDYDDILLRTINQKDLCEFKEFSSNISRTKYKLLLVKKLLEWAKSNNKILFKHLNIEQATNLALEFEKFLNKINNNQLNLDKLNNIVDEEYSKHWQEILNFLKVFGNKWNEFIKLNNIVSIPEFKTKMIEFNAKFFEKNKPENPIIFAGINSNIKSSCELIRNLVKYDNCYFIFKGLDNNLNENEWKNIDVFHPQYSLKYILENFIGLNRNEINSIKFEKNLIIDSEFEDIMSYVMLASNETYKWQNPLRITKNSLDHITKIECNDIFEEINVISYILKYKTQTESKSIGVIASDEAFAHELETKLKSLNLDVNNAFGNKIAQIELVRFLFLIINVVKTDFESISLLSLLKHDYSLFNYSKEKLNNLILLLEDKVLRGSGQINYKEIVKKINQLENNEIKEELNNFIINIREYLSPFIDLKNLTFQNIIKFHMELMEKISTNNYINGYEIFWNNEKNGSEILDFFQEIIEESSDYGIVENLDEYSNLLEYLIAENSYSDKYAIHPMINIISPQEAKLINYDLLIISNLNEGKFPKYIPTDPWMSKSMRKNCGLPEKEESIGSSAYDFVQFLSNKEVILLRSIKEDGVPTIKSRFLMRLETFLQCQNNLKIKENNIWKTIYHNLQSIDKIETIERPKPTPPLENRPKELFATDIEKLINNPYDIYAKKILKLKKKEEFYNDKIFAIFGIAVHESIENYINNYNVPENIVNKNEYLFEKFIKYGEKVFDKHFTNKISKELFFIKFLNIAKWFISEDEKIRSLGFKILTETTEKYQFDDINFTISAKIDRIEENEFGIINICDYKTGITPSKSDILKGKKPQLVIEAIILENKYKNKKIEKLIYWTVKGKDKNKIVEIANTNDIIEKGTQGLLKLITYFNVYENSYVATCYELGNTNSNFSDFKHLSRIDEWGYL